MDKCRTCGSSHLGSMLAGETGELEQTLGWLEEFILQSVHLLSLFPKYVVSISSYYCKNGRLFMMNKIKTKLTVKTKTLEDFISLQATTYIARLIFHKMTDGRYRVFKF